MTAELLKLFKRNIFWRLYDKSESFLIIPFLLIINEYSVKLEDKLPKILR